MEPFTDTTSKNKKDTRNHDLRARPTVYDPRVFLARPFRKSGADKVGLTPHKNRTLHTKTRRPLRSLCYRKKHSAQGRAATSVKKSMDNSPISLFYFSRNKSEKTKMFTPINKVGWSIKNGLEKKTPQKQDYIHFLRGAKTPTSRFLFPLREIGKPFRSPSILPFTFNILE